MTKLTVTVYLDHEPDLGRTTLASIMEQADYGDAICSGVNHEFVDSGDDSVPEIVRSFFACDDGFVDDGPEDCDAILAMRMDDEESSERAYDVLESFLKD